MRLCWGWIAIGIILLFAQPLSAADLNKADILKITDGDTVLLAVNGEEIKLRLLEVLCRGKQSAAVLKKLWRDNRAFFYVKLKGRDVYRRRLGTLFIIRNDIKIDVNHYMLKYGGCLPYRPKPRRWKSKQ